MFGKIPWKKCPQGESILDDFGDWKFFDSCGDLFDPCTAFGFWILKNAIILQGNPGVDEPVSWLGRCLCKVISHKFSFPLDFTTIFFPSITNQ